MTRNELMDGDVFYYNSCPQEILCVGEVAGYHTSHPSAYDTKSPVTVLVASKLRVPDNGLPKPDMVNAPSHYTRLSPEPMQVIEAWELDFQLGSALKYLARAGHKGGPEDEVLDLKKSVSFINRRIQRLEAKLKK